MSARAAALLCLLAAGAALADDGGAADPGEIPISVEVGRTKSLGVVMIPPLRCDDPEVVEAVLTEDGLGLRGLKPGSTLCSGSAANQQIFRYRVRVVPGAPAPPTPRKTGSGN